MGNMDQYETGKGPFGPVVNGTMVIEFYQYRPNIAAGYAFVALFSLATLAHFVYMVRLRSWIFIPFLLGGIAETFGYYGRALSHQHPARLGPWIQQNLLILVAAPLLTATIYLSLGRVTNALQANRHALISAKWMTKLYILIDTLCLMSQLAGTVMPASSDANLISLSRKVIFGGLLVQLVALTFFCYMTWHTSQGINKQGRLFTNADVCWRNHFRVIFVAATLVLLRSLIRAAEYGQGEHGTIVSNEFFIYLFDAAPMWLVMGLFLLLHPGRLLRDAHLLLGNGPHKDDVLLI